MKEQLREKLQELLQKPLEKMNGNLIVKNEDKDIISEIKTTFVEIAKNLFNNFYIICGDKEYYFAEIEFYYYNQCQYLKELFDWQKVTYCRTDKKVGDFLYHLSGIDICFNSKNDDKKAEEFGGILIRSIKDKNNIVVAAGPYTCRDFILNNCESKGIMPHLEYIKREKDYTPFTPKPFKRSLGKDDMKQNIDGELELCFYDDRLAWKTERISWDKKKKNFTTESRNYKKERGF